LFIVIAAVNDAPSISNLGNQTAIISSGAKAVSNFAFGFAPGGGTDEAMQTVSEFVVTNDNPSLFLSQPTIDTSGTLRYTPAATTGTANVGVRVRDNGGTLNGGVELSTFRNFTIALQQPAAVPPTVQSIVFGDGKVQRSMVSSITVDFSSIVTIANGAFTLERRNVSNGTWTSLATSALTIGVATSTISAGTRTRALLTFSGSEILGVSLADGNYRLTVNASLVTANGLNLDGDGNGTAGGNFVRGAVATDNFFRLFGDLWRL